VMLNLDLSAPVASYECFTRRFLFQGATKDGAHKFSFNSRSDGWTEYSIHGNWGSIAGSAKTLDEAQQIVAEIVRLRSAL
jgi:hypothetical protein